MGPSWDAVEGWFDPEVNGVLPDLWVPDAGAADWQGLLDLVHERGWPTEYSVDLEQRALPTWAAAIGTAGGTTIAVWPASGFRVNFFPDGDPGIAGDVDLRELQGQKRLDLLVGFIAQVGRRLRRRVALTPEGWDGAEILAYDPTVDRVRYVGAPGE